MEIVRQMAQRSRGILSRSCRSFMRRSSDARYAHNEFRLPPKSLADPLTPDERRRVKVLQLEYDSWKADVEPLPSKVSDKQWARIVRECPTEESRRLFYSRMLRYEKKNREKRSKPPAVQVEPSDLSRTNAREDKLLNDVLSIWPCQLQMDRRIELLPDEYRLAYSLQFGQPLVLDMRYGSIPGMDQMASAMCALHSYGANRSLQEPFHLHVCSVNPREEWYRLVRSHFSHEPAESSRARQWPDDFLATITHKSITDVFPRRSLVYLSPNSSEVMQKFDQDAVYVIGGLMDRKLMLPSHRRSLATATRLDIRCMCLPIHLYADWDYGSWCLAPNKVIRILGEVRQTGDWRQAFKRHLPVIDRSTDRRA